MITQRLLQAGEDVRILVRRDSPSEELAKQGMATLASSLIEAGAQPIYGDLKDRASLDAACKGIETVITTANSASRGGGDNVQTVDLEGNHNLIQAATATGVKQFIFTSALGADVNHAAPFMQAKARTEERLRFSGMPFTILAPTAFAEVWVGAVIGGPLQAGQPVTLVGEARRRHSFICMADVAAYATAAAGLPAAENQYLALGGPEALSWRDVVAKCAQVLGRELPLRFAAPGDPVPGLPEAAQPLMAGFETYNSVVDMTETARCFGVEPTPMEVVVFRGMAS